MDLSVDDAIRLVKAMREEGVSQFKLGELAVVFGPPLPVEVDFDPSTLGGYSDQDDEDVLFHSAGGR